MSRLSGQSGRLGKEMIFKFMTKNKLRNQSQPPSSRCGVIFTVVALLAWSSLSAQEEKAGLLPVVGAEIIDQGSNYQNSGGGPVGDRDPRKGTGHKLVDDDGSRVVPDFRGNSLVIDLGQVQKVTALRLEAGEKPSPETFNHLLDGGIELYSSFDNKTFNKIEGFAAELEPGEAPYLSLQEFEVEARYLKLHSPNTSGAYRIVGIVNQLLKAYGVAGPRTGKRLRVDFGLLQSGVNTVSVNTDSIRPSAKLKFRYQLWPYIREAETKPLEEGVVKVDAASGKAPWKSAKLDITKATPGFYRLSMECIDAADERELWREEMDLHLVAKLQRRTFPGSDEMPVLAPGDALVVTPGPDGDEPGGWKIDRRNPQWPLWFCEANRVSALSIPATWGGSAAVYLGIRGDGSATVSVGEESSGLKSSAGRSTDAITAAFFGIFAGGDSEVVKLGSETSPEPVEVAYLKVLALTPAQAEVADGKASAFEGRKLIFYSDGYSTHGRFDGPSNYTAEDFEKFADQFADSGDIVERFDFCQGTTSIICSHLSKVPHTEYPGQTGHYDTNYSKYVNQNIKENYIDKGINPIEAMGKRLQKHKVPLYVGYRMNAFYDPPNDLHYVSTYWREHPEFRVHPYRGKTFSPRSYAYPEVRDFNLAIMQEMLGLGVQGIHLEFMRHPPFVGYDAPLVEAFQKEHGASPLDPDFELLEEWGAAQTEVMTSYMRQVRALLDAEGEKQGTRFGITARIDYRNFRAQSLDPEQWAKEGLVDAIIPGDYTIRNHAINLAPFQKMVEGTKVKVYSSLSPEETGTRDPTPEDDAAGIPPPEGMIPTRDMKEIVVEAFRQGASGFYMFNNGGTGRYKDWRQFRGLEAWDIYENPSHLGKIPYSPTSTH